MSRTHRDTIFVEDAEVISQTTYPGQQFILRLHAPRCASQAVPGSFIHIRCEPEIPMRRPLSIMRANAADGWIEVLYKIVGEGLRMLGRAAAGDRLNLIGPIGTGFAPDPARPIALLIGGGVGIPPLLFLAEHLQRTASGQALAFFGSELPFPFDLVPAGLEVPGIAAETNASLALLETLGIGSRLASQAGLAGCYAGVVTELARGWLQAVDASQREQSGIYACGPEPMLQSAQALAREFGLPSQLCLEEFMACAVGGCAGCAVAVHLPDGVAMRRVCVDGPVFAGDTIYPAGS